MTGSFFLQFAEDRPSFIYTAGIGINDHDLLYIPVLFFSFLSFLFSCSFCLCMLSSIYGVLGRAFLVSAWCIYPGS